MIGQDYIHAKRLGKSNLFHCRDSAVHGDHQAVLSFGQQSHRSCIEAIAFFLAAGDIDFSMCTEAFERFQYDHGGTDTVAVIIAVNDDAFPVADGFLVANVFRLLEREMAAFVGERAGA